MRTRCSGNISALRLENIEFHGRKCGTWVRITASRHNNYFLGIRKNDMLASVKNPVELVNRQKHTLRRGILVVDDRAEVEWRRFMRGVSAIASEYVRLAAVSLIGAFGGELAYSVFKPDDQRYGV